MNLWISHLLDCWRNVCESALKASQLRWSFELALQSGFGYDERTSIGSGDRSFFTF